MDDKLTLNEHERITQILMGRNLHTKQKKSMQNVRKYINIRNGKKRYKGKTD